MRRKIRFNYKLNTCNMFNGKNRIKFLDEIRELSGKFQFLKENARDVILFLSEDGHIIEANKAAEDFYDYEYKELLNMNIKSLRASDFDCIVISEENNDSFKGTLFETFHKRKNGVSFPVEVSCGEALLNGKYAQIQIIRDITQRKSAENKLHKLAYYDSVTDLPNKKYLSEYTSKAIEKAKSENNMIAMLFIDLDRYKKVNDTMGHLIGDRLLKGAADRFKQLINENIFAARVGGDEFIFVQTNIHSAEEGISLARDILSELKQPFNFEGQEIYITASIGISVYPQHGGDMVTLMKNADMSMYRVKNNGRNNYELYRANMKEEAYEQIIIESCLHHSIENNELVLYYQPKYNALTREIVGMEALVRWQSPKLGLVPPIKFIGVAEESGLIVPIGRWVLETACKQNKQWQDIGLSPMRVAVNLSVRQFEEDNIVQVVEEVLKKTNLHPKYLELEVTETMAMKNMDIIIKDLRKLKDMGIHIALDDFGTGYSSLKYLRNIPVDSLKIDRAFINDINNNPSYGAIIDAIIEIAKNLKLGIIAEGVETIDQSNLLIQKNCYEMQGFLFSKPVTREEFEKLITAV